MDRRRWELSALEVFEVGKPWAEADGDIREAIDLYLEPEPFEPEKNKEIVELAI